MCSEIFLSGIGNARRDGGAANPVRTEHRDITAAASAIFASANANSWPIGEHHAYGMGSISQWRKGDKRGTFFREMPGAAAEYAMGLIKKNGWLTYVYGRGRLDSPEAALYGKFINMRLFYK